MRLWWESLDGDGALGFFVPIGSSNNFQGWAGAFNAKPPDGLVDTNLSPTRPPRRRIFSTISNSWSAATGSRPSVPAPFDASIGADLSEQVSFAIEYGDYDPSDPGSHAARTRLRIYLNYKF